MSGGSTLPASSTVDPPVTRDGYGPGDVHPFDGVLPQLADPLSYIPCALDLVTNQAQRDYWVALFEKHIYSLADHAIEEVADAGGDIEEAKQRSESVVLGFRQWLNCFAADPRAVGQIYGDRGRLSILDICYERERRLRAAGFADPYRLAKQRETQAALDSLADVLEVLDAKPPAERRLDITRGVFAGNIFDLGATKTQEMFKDDRVDFSQTLAKLKPRPWLIDGADAWLRGMERGWGCPLVFIDNAGPDVVLGMIPLVRELLAKAQGVIVAANTFPSLNDVTIDELTDLMAKVAAIDPVISQARQEGRLVLVGSGNGAPLIDLRRLSPELIELAEQGVGGAAVDLVVLEGMGRGVESNLDASFKCDALKVCMVKDEGVAEVLGGEVFDLVLRFDQAVA